VRSELTCQGWLLVAWPRLAWFSRGCTAARWLEMMRLSDRLAVEKDIARDAAKSDAVAKRRGN
jgi:hypothetical protein